jgi:hypothetical protein
MWCHRTNKLLGTVLLACRYSIQLQETALEIKQLAQQRDELGAAGKDTKGVNGKVKGRRAKSRNIIAEMNLWNAQLGNAAETTFTEQQISKLLEEGELPPEGVGVLQPLAHNLQLGKDFYMASNDLAHCFEEARYLEQEMARLRAWVDFMWRRCEKAWDEQNGKEALQRVQATDWDVAPADCATRVMVMHAEAGAPFTGSALHIWRHMHSLKRMKMQLGMQQ